MIYVVTTGEYFLSHRLALANAAAAQGAEVHVATGASDQEAAAIEALGFRHHSIPIFRRSVNLLTEGRTVAALGLLYRRVRPDLVHHVALKPILYGSLAARLCPSVRVVNLLTGLGYAFIGESLTHRVLHLALAVLLPFALGRKNTITIFQNGDDLQMFLKRRWLKAKQVRLVRGSGVDTERFAPKSPATTTTPPIVMLPGRMLKDKGVEEFVAAARRLKARGVACQMTLVGRLDPENRAAISKAELDNWVQQGLVTWLGHQSDMAGLFGKARVVALPSYREGVPLALLEAASCGRVLVASNVPGCRDVVIDGKNGFLVPAKDGDALADAIERALTLAPEKTREMERASRDLVVQHFSIAHVIQETLGIYRDLLVTT